MLLSFVAVPLLEPFYRANLRLLLWLNGYVADHPALYRLALFLTDRGSDILMLLTLVLLWFWARNQNPHTVFGDAPLVLQKQQRPWQLRRLSGAALKFLLASRGSGSTERDFPKPVAAGFPAQRLCGAFSRFLCGLVFLESAPGLGLGGYSRYSGPLPRGCWAALSF
jgi:hypothetical protein